MGKSLLAAKQPLSSPEYQLNILEPGDKFKPFLRQLADFGLSALQAKGIQIFQVNVGKLCNQTCAHCHVDAGPDRKEIMSKETMQLCLRALAGTQIPTVDITGGAPELVPHYRWFVEEIKKLGRYIIDRCNLTILMLPKYADLPQFFAKHQIEVIASLPYYLEQNTDAQRGKGVFVQSIEALKKLNAVGYGQPETGLILNLVYNPVGAFLPPPQKSMEHDYKRELQRRYAIVFNQLYTITNMPISRFLDFLISTNNYEGYMQRLIAAFNPVTVNEVMCRNTISVGWDGTLYDCDFNQMLDLPVADKQRAHIKDFDLTWLNKRPIVTRLHCYGCTAGSGSSCAGSITKT